MGISDGALEARHEIRVFNQKENRGRIRWTIEDGVDDVAHLENRWMVE